MQFPKNKFTHFSHVSSESTLVPTSQMKKPRSTVSPVHSRAEVPPLSSYPGPSPVLSEMPSESTATPCYWEGRPTCLVCPRNLHLVCAPKAGHALTTSPRLHRPCGPVQQQEQWLQSASGPGRTLPGGHDLMKVLRSWPWTQHSPCNSTLTLQA